MLNSTIVASVMLRPLILLWTLIHVVPLTSCVRKSSHEAELKKETLEKPNSDLLFLFDAKEKSENSKVNIHSVDDNHALGYARRGVNIDHIRFEAYKPLTHGNPDTLELTGFPVYQYPASKGSWLFSFLDALYYQGHVANLFQDSRQHKLRNMLQNGNQHQFRHRPIDARELGKQIAWTTSAQRSGSFRIYDNENRGNWQQVLESIFASRLGMEAASFQKDIRPSTESAGMDNAVNRAAEIQNMLNQIDTGIKVVGEHLHMNTKTSDKHYLDFFCMGQVVDEECEIKRPERGTAIVYIVDRLNDRHVLSRAVRSITPSSNNYLWKVKTYGLPNGDEGDSFTVTLEDSSKGKCVSTHQKKLYAKLPLINAKRQATNVPQQYTLVPQYTCNVLMKFTVSGLPIQ